MATRKYNNDRQERWLTLLLASIIAVVVASIVARIGVIPWVLKSSPQQEARNTSIHFKNPK